MKDDPLFLISFVNSIEKYPCLWNYTLKEYSKRDVTELAWKNIAAEVRDSEHNCRDRWKNIRCAFVRSQKSPRSGSGGKSKKQYYLAEHLSFLTPYIKGKLGSGNLSMTFDNAEYRHDDADDERTSNGPKDPITSSDTEHDESPSSIIEQEISSRKRKLTAQRTFQPKADAFKQWVNMKQNKNKEDDTDLLFLRSLLPDVKKLAEKQKRTFKRKVMRILDEMLDEIEQPRSPVACFVTSIVPSRCVGETARQIVSSDSTQSGCPRE